MIKTRNQSRLEAQTRIDLAEKEKNKFKDYQYIVNKLAKISKKKSRPKAALISIRDPASFLQSTRCNKQVCPLLA